jgi:hypothetical protein
MDRVTLSHDLRPDAVRSERAAIWLEDLNWHKDVYRYSRFQWWGEHVIKIVTSRTGGRLNFTTVADLQFLSDRQREHVDYAARLWLALAAPLSDAYETMGSWEAVAGPLGLTRYDCRGAVGVAGIYPPEEAVTPDSKRISEMVNSQVFKNPFILAWEMKQMWAMHQAAVDMFEDTICDLVGELRGTRPGQILAAAIGVSTSGNLDGRIRKAHAARGQSGDPRRVPSQTF